MRLILAIASALLLLSPFAAGAQAPIPLPDRVQKAGKLVAATYPNYPPLTFRDPATNARLGFDVELVEAIGKTLGVAVEWQEMPFVQFIPALQTGRIDLAADGISDIPSRRETIDFIDYLRTGAQFYTLETRQDIKELMDLCGKKVGASRSTEWPANIEAWSQQHCVAAGKAPIAVTGTEGSIDTRTQLRTGRLDAGVQGNETIGWLQQAEPNVYRVLGAPFTEKLVGIPVAKSEPVLRDAIKAALERLVASGTYVDLLKKWNLAANAAPAITINAGK